jgi:6-phosphogluconolactonase
VDRDGRALVVANYSGGSVAAIALQPDGRLGALGTVVQHSGSSVNPARQKGPHAHVVTVAPGNRHVLCADLGLDQVLVYQFDAATATLRANEPAFVRLPPGSGPRHLAFHPGGRTLYAINELLCTMAVFDFDAARGGLKEVQLVSTLPPGESVQPGFSTAEVAVHPGGRFLYGSNRGHNTIVVYAIDSSTGRIRHVANTPTEGKTPRHFALDPSGAWLLAENQDSDTVVVFRIDPDTGALTPTGQSLTVPSPVCAVFVAAN